MARKKSPKYKNNISTNHNIKGTGYAFEDFFTEQAVQPGARFFYFVSLGKGYNGPNAKQYATRAMRALSSAHQDTTFDAQQQDYMETLKSILQVIEGFQQYEAANEYAIFQQKLEPLLELAPDLYQEFSDTFKDGKIDYIRFMALLKILNQDIKTVQHELLDLQAHAKDFNDKYQEALDAAARVAETNKYTGPVDKYTLSLQTRVERVEEARENVAKSMSDMEELLSNGLQRIRLIKKRTKQDQLDMKQIEAIVQKMITLGESKYDYEDIRKEAKLADKNAYMFQFIGELQRQAKASDKTFQAYLTQLNQELEPLDVQEDSANDIRTDATKQLVDSLKACFEYSDLLEQQYQSIEKIFNSAKKINTSKGNWKAGAQYSGLTKARRSAILRAISRMPGVNVDNLHSLEELESRTGLNTTKEDRFDIRRKKDFDTYLALLRKTVPEYKNLSTTNLINKLEELVKSSDSATKKQIITITSETGGALDLAKIMQALTTRLGQQNFREDWITVGTATYTTYDDENEDNTLLDEDITRLQKMSAELLAQRKTNLYKNIRQINRKEGRSNNEYDVNATLRASQQEDQKIAEELMQKYQINDMQKLHDMLQNLFIIEGSEKFATTFNAAEFGFSGGSLGAGIEEQVKNINNMLELGGITPLDYNFLINAIMNAGPGMLGYNQKDKLETYLSSIAAVCMFSSGAQSLKDYAESVKQAASQIEGIGSMSTTKIHIFSLGKLYVPLSYILHLIYIGLEKCVNTLGTAVLDGNAGAKVTIFNPVNEATDKVSKKYKSPHRGREYYIGDWYATAEQGLPKVTLNMAILGSYLDVLEDINKILANVF